MPKRQTEFAKQNLITDALRYLHINEEVKKFEKEKKEISPRLKENLKQVPTEVEGQTTVAKIEVPHMKDMLYVGNTETQSVRMVDDIVDQLRNLVGKDAEMFIVKQEIVLPNALETLLQTKKITEEQFKDLIVITKGERLTVKTVKKK